MICPQDDVSISLVTQLSFIDRDLIAIEIRDSQGAGCVES